MLVFRDFATGAQYFKDTAITHALLKRLGETDNAYVYMPITETILSYNDPALNILLVKAIRANQRINDWGYKRVQDILSEHNLKL